MLMPMLGCSTVVPCLAAGLILTACDRIFGGGGDATSADAPGTIDTTVPGDDTTVSGDTWDPSAIVTTFSEPGPGTATLDEATGVRIYEGAARVVAPGVELSHMLALTPADSSGARFHPTSVLRVSVSARLGQPLRVAESIPKNLAAHVDDLRVRVVSSPTPLTTAELVADDSALTTVAALVEQGQVEIVEEDPLLVILVGGAVAIGATYFVFEIDKSRFVDVAPLMTAARLENEIKATGGLVSWMDARLGQHCDTLKASAAKNGIPPRLLATVILNELGDYTFHRQFEEFIDAGPNASHGWIQLQAQRLLDHRLIDVGPAGSLRDPTVDIDEASLTHRTAAGGLIASEVSHAVWERLVNPRAAVELAAREVRRLMDLLAEGSPYLANPWAQALLVDPARGIDPADPYANLRIRPDAGDVSDPVARQIELERTLALIVVAGYNGAGAIYAEKDASKLFVFGKDPWGPETSGPYEFPRNHANNAMTIFPDEMLGAWCLAEKPLLHVFKVSGVGYRKLWGGEAEKRTGYHHEYAELRSFETAAYLARQWDFAKRTADSCAWDIPICPCAPYPDMWESGSAQLMTTVGTYAELEPYRCDRPHWGGSNLICNAWDADASPDYWASIGALCGR